MVLTDPQQQRDCLRRVIKINPANVEAATRLAELAAKAVEIQSGQ